MSDRIWHKGPPPHVGWWNASAMHLNDCWRWWDGQIWSEPAYPHQSANSAAVCADLTSERSHESIHWTDYYPENARVPRIDPRKA